MSKGVYNMPNVYAKGKNNKSIFYLAYNKEKANPRKEISDSIVNTCVKRLSKEINVFVNALSKSIMQEK